MLVILGSLEELVVIFFVRTFGELRFFYRFEYQCFHISNRGLGMRLGWGCWARFGFGFHCL